MEKVDEVASPCGGDGGAGDRRPGSGGSTDAAPPDLGLSAAPPAADIVAQAYPAPPSYPPAPPQSTASLAPNPPPPPETETPAPAPTYVWEPGHWSWNGAQYHWQRGRYIAKPTTTYIPGHWEQRPEGWLWVGGQWNYGAQRPGG
jgi:hypothetical protein